jgi:hypothetical protein
MPHLYAKFAYSTALTQLRMDQVDGAFQDLGVNNDANPCNNVHWRWATDNKTMIVESNFPGQPTKAQVVTAMAARTGIAAATINANLTISLYADRQAAADDIAANAALWGES